MVNDNENRVLICALDSNKLLIAVQQIDAIFMISFSRHFTNLHSALSEINSVTKSSSIIAFGIEPNKLWSYILIVLRPNYRIFIQSKTHSAADEEAEGFSIGNFREIGRKYDWQIIDLKPVWFFTGFLHNGLEFIFRVFRLKKRITVPIILEKVIVKCADFLFKIPLMKYLAWHYSVIYK